jgi:hypothetical protein
MATIPYPANQMKGVEGVLRVDKKFRTYGSEQQKMEYHKRPPIEAVNTAFLRRSLVWQIIKFED